MMKHRTCERRLHGRSRRSRTRWVEQLESRAMLAGDDGGFSLLDEPCQSVPAALWLATPRADFEVQTNAPDDQAPPECDRTVETKHDGETDLAPGVTFEGEFFGSPSVVGAQPTPTPTNDFIPVSTPVATSAERMQSLPLNVIDQTFASIEFHYFETSVESNPVGSSQKRQDTSNEKLLSDTIMTMALLEPNIARPAVSECLDGPKVPIGSGKASSVLNRVDESGHSLASSKTLPGTLSLETIAALAKADAAIASLEMREPTLVAIGQSVQRVSEPREKGECAEDGCESKVTEGPSMASIARPENAAPFPSWMVSVITMVSLMVSTWPSTKTGQASIRFTSLRVWRRYWRPMR